MHSENSEEHLPPPESGLDENPGESSPAHAAEPWTLTDLFFFIVFATVTFFFTAFLGLAGYAALRPLMGWHTSPQAMAQNTFFLLGAQLAFYVLIFAYIYFLIVFHYRLGFWQAIRWGNVTQSRVLRFIAAGIVMWIAVQMTSFFLPDKTTFPLERMFNSPGASYALAAFAITVGPFMEELIFRGVLFSIFEVRTGLPFAIVITAALFGAMHIPEYSGAWYHVLFIFLVGLVLSITRGLTGSLAPSVIMHITYNGCLMVILFFATSHFRVIQSFLK